MSKNVHDRLREVRDEVAGMSQPEMADALADDEGFTVSPGSVGNYERGNTGKVPVEYLKRVCERFDVSPEWIVTGNGPRHWGRGDREARRRAVIADYLERELMKYAEPSPQMMDPNLFVRDPDRNDQPDGNRSAATP